MEFEEIYRRYFRDIYRFCLGLTQDGPLAEEIAQDTFFKALLSGIPYQIIFMDLSYTFLIEQSYHDVLHLLLA